VYTVSVVLYLSTCRSSRGTEPFTTAPHNAACYPTLLDEALAAAPGRGYRRNQ
jgi:hypothetical protein